MPNGGTKVGCSPVGGMDSLGPSKHMFFFQ